MFDPAAALAPGAPLVHDERGGNLVNLRYQFAHGDVEAAFARADAVVVEGEYRLNYVTTACLGTMVAIAAWSQPEGPDASLTMWSTTQVPFLYQRDLAEALGITGDRVRVMQPPVGGNFGRGLDLYPIDIIAALLARRAGRPVKIAFERIEEFIASPTREPCVIHLRTAADRDGRLLARDARVVIDNGAYVSWGSTTPYVMLSTTAGLYRVPAVRFDTTIVYTNNPYSGSMRGYGNLESTFAIEAQMDDLAERLGLDPRRDPPPQRHAVGRREPAGQRHHLLRDDRVPGRGRARDAAGGGRGPAARLAPRGRLRGDVPRGRRRARLPLRRLRGHPQARRLRQGLAAHRGQRDRAGLGDRAGHDRGRGARACRSGGWRSINSDTAVKPWDVGVHASRTTFIAGNAALLAARDAARPSSSRWPPR